MADALDETEETVEPHKPAPSGNVSEEAVGVPQSPHARKTGAKVEREHVDHSDAGHEHGGHGHGGHGHGSHGHGGHGHGSHGHGDTFPIPARPTPPTDAADHPPATLKGRYLIFPSLALPELDSPTATAYTVEDRREPNRQLFALICTPGLPARTQVMAKLRSETVSGLMPMIEYGPVHWSPLGQSCQSVILERPQGGRFLDAFTNHKIRISEYELARRIMTPLAQALNELQALDIAHRALRIDNLYYMDKEKHELVLGECVSAPPGFDQPTIYEPLNRAMATPSGRGSGSTGDDLYALGVMSVFLLLGYNPVSVFKEEDVIAAKAERGSYQCLCGKERIPLPLIEPLRGLLSDEVKERWDSEALDSWLNGQKRSPIQHHPAPKPKIVFKFLGHDHTSPHTIAQSFSKNVNDAAKVIKGGKLELWLRQSYGSPELADAVIASITISKVHASGPDGSDEILVSKVCMRLDPDAPVRYKNFAVMPDGFGAALAVEYLRKGNFQIPGEILARDLMGYWFAAQNHMTPDLVMLDRTFKTLRGFAAIHEMGYGLDRCLYELNRFLPCQSDFLQKLYIDHIDELLPALDDMADKADMRSRPMDKHLAAFIATHFKHDIHPHLKALSEPKTEISLIGMLSLFALMQWHLKIDTLFGLSSWIGGLLQPAIGTYHSRTTRRTIELEIPALVRQGSLPDLFDLIDNAERRGRDKANFEEAQIEFTHAEEEIQKIVGEDVDQQKMALESGEKMTAMFAIIFCMIATTAVIFVKAM